MIHPSLIIEFNDRCKSLKIKNPEHLIAAMMRVVNNSLASLGVTNTCFCMEMKIESGDLKLIEINLRVGEEPKTPSYYKLFDKEVHANTLNFLIENVWSSTNLVLDLPHGSD